MLSPHCWDTQGVTSLIQTSFNVIILVKWSAKRWHGEGGGKSALEEGLHINLSYK